MLNHNIDIDKVPIGIIPFGTGNDLSRVLGWGGTFSKDLVNNHMNNLKFMVKKWIEAIT